MQTRTLLLLLSFLLLGGGLQSAFAHAEILGSDPAPGSRVSDLENLLITFSEPVYNPLVRLLSNTTEYPLVTRVENEATVIAEVPADLPKGTYQVLWSVESVDGHLISGSYGFEYGISNTRYALGVVMIVVSLVLFFGVMVHQRYYVPAKKQ